MNTASPMVRALAVFSLFGGLVLGASACKQEPLTPLGPAPNPEVAAVAAPGHGGGAAVAAEGGAADPTADSGPRGDAAAGKVVFEKVCQACHQADGSGLNGMLAADFKKNPARLGQKDSVLLGHIADGFKTDKLIMPPQKTVTTEQERKDALAYMRKAFGKK